MSRFLNSLENGRGDSRFIPRSFLERRDGAARVQAVDFRPAEPELLENLSIVFAKRRSRFAGTLATPCT